MFENPRRGRQARNFTTNVPKILDLKLSSEQFKRERRKWRRKNTNAEIQRLQLAGSSSTVFAVNLILDYWDILSRRSSTNPIFLLPSNHHGHRCYFMETPHWCCFDVIFGSPFQTIFIATFSISIILWLLHKFSNICKSEEGWYGQPKYCYKKQYTLLLESALQ